MTLSQADIDSLLGSQPADDVGSLLDKPATGEDIATALQDPTFTPTVDQYKQFEEYNKTKQTDWLQTVLSAADSITQTAGQAAKAAVTTGAALNPKNYLEGLAQGTAQLYGLVAQSQNPDSPLFKLNNLISGTGTLENRYTQFIQARQFNKDLDAYAKGDMTIMFPPEQLNPEFVQGVAMVADPTMFLPGIGQALGVEKVGAKAVGKAAQIAGRGVQAVARPVEMAAGAAERAITGITGVSPEALRGGLATSGVLAATGAAPAVGLIGAVPLAAAGAMDVGRAIEAAGIQLGRAPTRIGALESIGKIPEANLRQRVIGTIGRYGGDAALNAALVGTTGSLEGAAIGGVLGYLSGGEEGAAAGIGSGAAAGALGSLGARGVQTLTGSQARAARLNDLTTYIDTLPENKKAAYQTVQERFGTDTASNLMDLETAIRGTRSDITVDLLTGDEFKKQAGVTARGIVPQENAPTPRILINVDAFSRGKGDTPIYTLGHELVHALASTKQFQGDITALTERLTGAYIPNPDGTMRLTAEGEYTPAKVEELFNQYVNKLPDEVKAKAITDNPTAADRAAYVGEELVAEQVGRILSAQKPDAFLRGFGTTRQSFTDMLILQDASRAASRIGQYFEKTFGVTPSDSILFPEIKQSSPILDASLRQLLKARENISEALQKAEFQKSFAINQNNISDPTVADFAVRGGFAVREPDGTVRLLTNGELLDREQRDVRQVKEIVDKLPGARFDIDGNLVGQLSKEQADALNASSVSSQMKERITAVNQAINEGRSVLNEYYPATEKKQDPQSKRWRTRYAGRRMTFRETLFYNLLFSKEGNAYARGIDLTKIRSSLQKHVRNGGVAGLWPDVGAFMGDLAAYLTNRERGENAIPTRQLLGPDKAEFMGSFLNSFEKGGSEFIHSFRLDRFGKMDPGDFRARFGETGYRGMKDRLMPAGTVGDAEAFKSQSGYTVLAKNNKFRLYGPDGALLGIYDSSQKAEKKIYATEARLQPEIDQLQRPARNEVRQTAEAGGRNRSVSRTQGSQAGGEVNQQVRQAGDVGRFMPDQQGFYSKLEEVVTNKLPKSATPQQILATVDPAKGSGVKAEELKWTGFAQAVERIAKENGGKVPKEKLMEHLQNEGRVRFEEVDLSEKTVWTVGDQGHSEKYTDLNSALKAKKDIEDFWSKEIEKGWDVVEQDGDFVIVDDYGDPVGVQRSDSGRDVWEPEASYSSESEAYADLKNGAKEVARSLVYWNESQDGADFYSRYQLPGGQNYREIVLTSDTAAPYTSSHFEDIPNYVAHMRVNERALPVTTDVGAVRAKVAAAMGTRPENLGSGAPEYGVQKGLITPQEASDWSKAAGFNNKYAQMPGTDRLGLFIEEIQSDRHQQARDKGYAQTREEWLAFYTAPDGKEVPLNYGNSKENALSGVESGWKGLVEIQTRKTKEWSEGIPDAPFRKDWSLQMFKRGLRDAVASGKEWIGWTTGIEQVKRYENEFRKSVDTIRWNDEGLKHNVVAIKDGQNVFSGRFDSDGKGLQLFNGEEASLSDVVGKDIAAQIIKGEGKARGVDEAEWSGNDLTIGGEGMKGFYDQILPAEVQKYVKQWGGEVKKSNIPEAQIWRVDITPQMRESVQKTGQPRFMPSDTDYLAAVKAGDTQAAQQMVDQAAKAAGYTIGPVYHGTNADFNVFIPGEGMFGKGIYLAKDYEYAKNFADKTTGRVVSLYAKIEDGKTGKILPNKRGGIYVAESPEQVKLADTIVFDDSGNVIPLSQRFQQSSADIRYMPSEKLESVVDGVVSEANRLGFEITDEHSSGFGSQYITIRDPESNREWKMRFSDHERQLSSVTQHAAPNFEQVGNLNLEKAIIWLRKKREIIENPPQIDAKQYEKQKVAKAADEVLMYEQKIRDLEANRDKRISQGNTKKAANLQTQIDQIKNSMGYKSALNEANQPRYMPQPDPSVPGAYSVTGGFRILPGKTKGRLRVYGPSGSLVGIAGSLDEAQRMIRRKTKSN